MTPMGFRGELLGRWLYEPEDTPKREVSTDASIDPVDMTQDFDNVYEFSDDDGWRKGFYAAIAAKDHIAEGRGVRKGIALGIGLSLTAYLLLSVLAPGWLV